MEDLIAGYTYNGAYQMRMNENLGSIEVRKTADRVVLEDNLFEINLYDIHKTKVALTVMEGEVIFKRK